ncbi:uncharacterized protein J3D65DRAFT_640332, partial [Phyllosticta citribraziliensis]
HFSLDSLRELFQYRPDTTSDTHATCKPDGRQRIKAPAMLYGDTSTWNHFSLDSLRELFQYRPDTTSDTHATLNASDASLTDGSISKHHRPRCPRRVRS